MAYGTAAPSSVTVAATTASPILNGKKSRSTAPQIVSFNYVPVTADPSLIMNEALKFDAIKAPKMTDAFKNAGPLAAAAYFGNAAYEILNCRSPWAESIKKDSVIDLSPNSKSVDLQKLSFAMVILGVAMTGIAWDGFKF